MINIEKLPVIKFEKQKEAEGGPEKTDSLFEVYSESELLNKLNFQRDKGEDPSALFTDVDHTFHKAGRENAMAMLTKKARERSTPIVAVTGNDFKGLYERITRRELPYFDAILGSVGTEIWILSKDKNGQMEYKQDQYFKNLMLESGFEREKLVKESMQLIEELKISLPEINLDFQNPKSEQQWLSDKSLDCQPFKISFYFFANQQRLEEMSKIAGEKFDHQAVLICEEINYNSSLPPKEKNKKYCLDILPITKGDAVNYLSKLAGIEKGIVAGDSGNDVDMLLRTGNLNAVLVGGYKKEAKKEIDQAISNKKPGKRSFQSVTQADGSIKAIYIEQEPEKRQAADSILRAAEILVRAENIKKIRETQNDSP